MHYLFFICSFWGSGRSDLLFGERDLVSIGCVVVALQDDQLEKSVGMLFLSAFDSSPFSCSSKFMIYEIFSNNISFETSKYLMFRDILRNIRDIC